MCDLNKIDVQQNVIFIISVLYMYQNVSDVHQAGKLALARSPMRVKIWLGKWKTGLGE